MSIFAESANNKKDSIFIDKGFCLSLSYQGLDEIPEDVVKKHFKETTSIDLSYNIFKYLFISTYYSVSLCLK